MRTINAIVRPDSKPNDRNIFSWIPIFGWVINYNLSLSRSNAVMKSIDQELQQRPSPKLSDWGDDEKAFSIAKTISSICKDVLGWSNNHFYPGDSFAAMVEWETGDLCELEALEEMESQLDYPNLDSLIEADLDISLGKVVNLILKYHESDNNDNTVQNPKK